MIVDERRLLALEVDAIFGLVPGSGGPPALRDGTVRAVLAWSPGARLLALAPDTPAPDSAASGADGQDYAPGERPDVLVRLAEALGGGAALEGGPSYVFPERLAAVRPSPLPLIVSDAAGRSAARRLVRPGNWLPGEWRELIDGRFGQWAMAVHGDEAVSICHSPATSAAAAEAGIWTREDFRGRRLAPAVVAAWSERERRHRDVLFYSTSAGNHASRSVARALGLSPLGWIWKVVTTT